MSTMLFKRLSQGKRISFTLFKRRVYEEDSKKEDQSSQAGQKDSVQGIEEAEELGEEEISCPYLRAKMEQEKKQEDTPQ